MQIPLPSHHAATHSGWKLPGIIGVLTLVCSMVDVPAAAADKPAIDRVFPPGGQLGTTVETRLNGKSGDDTLMVWSDRQQLNLTISDKKDAATIVVPEDAGPGVHWLRFYNVHGATEPLPFVVGTLPELAEQEPNNRLDEAQACESPSIVINGVLEKSGDVDCYSMPVKTGQTLVASMLANRILNSPMDAVLQLLNSEGTILWQNDDDHALDPQIVFTAEKDDTWIVRTFAFPAAPNSSIQFAGGSNYVYRLILTVGPFVDHTMPGVVTAGQSQPVTLEGWNLDDTVRQVTADATQATVGSRVCIPGLSLAEPCCLETVDAASFTEDQAAAELTVPFHVSGRISEPRQQDEFRFFGQKGQKIACRAVARATYSMLDPLLSVHSDDGKELKQADDISKENLDADTSLTLPADGVYTVRIRDRFDHGGFRHFYRLQVQDLQPDFSLTVEDHQLHVAVDKPTDVSVNVNRTDGFSEDIQITVTGLPEGITCEPGTSNKDGDSSKKVTLKLTGQSTTGFQGPVQITGTSTAGSARLCDAKGIASEGPRTSIWLTVPSTPAADAPAADPAGTESSPTLPESEPASTTEATSS